MSFLVTIKESMIDNFYIVGFAVAAFILWVGSIIVAHGVNKHFKRGTDELKVFTYYFLDVIYTLFITIVSLFPLLGMFGTVKSLIELGGVFEAGGGMDGIKSEFFLALTSTALGIIFSVFFKTINAFAQPFIENQIDKARKALNVGKSL